ncbi:MAG: ATP-binding protein [Bacteroidales bacterium]|jgi:predicted HTH transcriptional regulator|nr:ATP-binding protein [Bacteroidales bacterium]
MIDITNIARLKENFCLEAKKAVGCLPASLWETYSAFANTNGGVILLGISEEDNVLRITGVQDASKKIQDIWNTLNNRQKVSANVLTEKRIYKQKVDDKEIIVIELPRADRHDKPVYINNDLFGRTFRRNAEGDYHCSRQAVKSMLRDQSDLPIDSVVIYELSWNETWKVLLVIVIVLLRLSQPIYGTGWILWSFLKKSEQYVKMKKEYFVQHLQVWLCLERKM